MLLTECETSLILVNGKWIHFICLGCMLNDASSGSSSVSYLTQQSECR